MKAVRIALLSGIMLLSGGCLFQKKATVRVPVAVPPPPVASTPEPTPAAEQPAASVAPPVTPPAQPPAQPAQTPPATESGKPSPFPPVSRPTPPRASTPTPPPAIVTPAPTPTPALGAMLTPELKRQLDATYVSDLNRANEILRQLSGKTLTVEQRDSVNRARAWIRQAGEYHSKDLATAAELARRARLLTQDLAGALK